MIIMLTIKEAARTRNIPEHAVRRWVAEGALPAVRSGKKHLLAAENLDAFLLSGLSQKEDNISSKGAVG